MSLEKKRRIWVALGFGTAGIAAVAILYFLLEHKLLDIPCLFRRATGWLCPGCGNTGAARALLRLDVAAAFQYNPLCFLEFGYIVWLLANVAVSYIRRGKITYRSPCMAVDIVVLIVILVWGVYRNFL